MDRAPMVEQANQFNPAVNIELGVDVPHVVAYRGRADMKLRRYLVGAEPFGDQACYALLTGRHPVENRMSGGRTRCLVCFLDQVAHVMPGSENADHRGRFPFLRRYQYTDIDTTMGAIPAHEKHIEIRDGLVLTACASHWALRAAVAPWRAGFQTSAHGLVTVLAQQCGCAIAAAKEPAEGAIAIHDTTVAIGPEDRVGCR